jgi:type VI secretion system FHA domain protein
MPLTLEVIGHKAALLGSAARKVFEGSGTIGRLRNNDWVLPQEYISGRHAKIVYTDGGYFIEDTSTNGVFMNSPQNRLARGEPYELHDGDTLFIDDFEVRVSLGRDGGLVAHEPPRAEWAPHAAMIPEDPFGGDPLESIGEVGETDPLKLLGIESPRAINAAPSAASLAGQSPMSQHFRPPAATVPSVLPDDTLEAQPLCVDRPPSVGLIPDDYDPFAPEASAPQAPAFPPRPAVTPQPPMRARQPMEPQPENPASKSSAVASGGAAPASARLREVGQPPIVSAGRARAAASEPAAASPSASAPASRSPSLAPSASPPRARSRPAAAQRPGNTPSSPRVNAPDLAAAAAIPSSSAQSAFSAASRAVNGAGSGAAAPMAPAGNLDFATLLAAAGIDAALVTPELAQQFGQILRVVVAGLMDVLRAREKIKDEFRMRMTTFKAADNNPLKFSANVEDALHNLLVKRNAAYLGPVDAFEDAFEDLRNHQMAILAGMRVAYGSMLEEFNPDSLQEEFDRHTKAGSFLSGLGKQRYWDLYRNRFHDMVKDADTSFRRLFGEEFAKAYEDQLVKLREGNPVSH